MYTTRVLKWETETEMIIDCLLLGETQREMERKMFVGQTAGLMAFSGWTHVCATYK